jgi:hypothetical protein
MDHDAIRRNFRARYSPRGRRLGNHLTGVIGDLFKSHIRIEGFRVVTWLYNNSLERTRLRELHIRELICRNVQLIHRFAARETQSDKGKGESPMRQTNHKLPTSDHFELHQIAEGVYAAIGIEGGAAELKAIRREIRQLRPL